MRRWVNLLLCGSFMALAGTAVLAKEEAPPYLAVVQLDSTRFLAPPPGAEQTRREIEWMLVLQRQRTPEQAASAAADSEQSVFRFADVMGPQFDAQNLPATATFFKRLLQTERVFNRQGKNLWQRLRPPLFDKRIEPVSSYSSSGSYPSGHSTFGFLSGIALADMVPEKRPQIFARAKAFGDHRVLGGVHYPSDVEAGRQLAVMIAVLAQQDDAYRQDFAAARSEVRRMLNLP